MKTNKIQRIIASKIVPRIILILMCFIFILPYYWMIISSLKSSVELRTAPPTLFPHEFHFEHYAEALKYIPFVRYMTNSLIIVVFSVLGAIVSNSLISYGISRIPWKGRKLIFSLVIGSMFIPFPVILVALFDIFAKLHLVNSFFPLIIPAYTGGAMHIFMMRQYLLGLPMEISDAGYIDGANEFQIFRLLILPLMKPVIAVVAIFTALAHWNDFMGPLIYIQDQNLYPLSIGLQFFRSEQLVEYSMLMAASTLVVLPVVVIFLCFQRFFIQGITVGSLKG
ncbi:sugar ABC transporter permease [Spirochaetia bacterium]|nr:sugar ABC transporter permease [Spirochaetia bacterium]